MWVCSMKVSYIWHNSNHQWWQDLGYVLHFHKQETHLLGCFYWFQLIKFYKNLLAPRKLALFENHGSRGLVVYNNSKGQRHKAWDFGADGKVQPPTLFLSYLSFQYQLHKQVFFSSLHIILFLLTWRILTPHSGLDHPLVEKLCKYHFLSLYIEADVGK